jgi:peroxiredoxin
MRPELNVLGISKDSIPAILAFKKRHGLLFPILLDVKKELVPDYRRVTFPTLVLVGPDKKIIQLYEGEVPPAEAAPLLQMLTGN